MIDIKQFEKDRSEETGSKIMTEVSSIMDYTGKHFLELDGDDLHRCRLKLIGFKFNLSDYLCELDRMSKMLVINSKEEKSSLRKEISDKITLDKGKPASMIEIEKELEVAVLALTSEAMLYESMYYKYRIKISAIDDVISAIMQRVKELTAQAYDSRQS